MCACWTYLCLPFVIPRTTHTYTHTHTHRAASGTGGDATVASKSLEITVDDNMWPKMIEANGETANVVDRYGPNANGFVADALNDGKKNGYVYYIDKVCALTVRCVCVFSRRVCFIVVNHH